MNKIKYIYFLNARVREKIHLNSNIINNNKRIDFVLYNHLLMHFIIKIHYNLFEGSRLIKFDKNDFF